VVRCFGDALSAPESPQPATSVPLGSALMLLGVVSMVGLDVSVKWLLQSYSLSQVVFLRCVFSVLFIFLYGLSQGGLAVLRTNRLAWHLLRSILMAGTMFAFFHALRSIPLADAFTFAFTAPLIVTALSKPFLGEPVGPWRWAGVITGFIGVLIVLQPGVAVVHPAALMALGGAVLYAVLSLTARKLSTTETTVSLSIYLFPIPLLAGAAVSLGEWISVDRLDWLVFALSGLFGGMGFVCINGAFRRAPAAILVPFEYTALIWAAAVGYLLWGEVPARTTWLGAAFITASGLFVLYRETVLHRVGTQLDFPLQEAVGVESKSDYRLR